MNIKVRPLKRSDTAEVVTGWNTSLPYDVITDERFDKTIFEDPNYEEAGNLIALHHNKIIGFAAAVAREGTAGRDGAGQPSERDFGYLKGLFMLKKYRRGGLGKHLLERVLRYLTSKGKTRVKVGHYTGRYFFPGIDTQHEEEIEFYRRSGFEEIDAEEDVVIDLQAFQPTEYQEQAQRRIEQLGVAVKPYQPEFLERMHHFVERIDYPQWFPPGWERDFAKEHHHLVALLAREIAGWARFGHSRHEGWWFGPIAVLEDVRRRGIGTCLLVESMLKMKALGAQSVTAGWATVPFYVKNEWTISRRYLILQKDLIS
jgi:GNAT superfamily N-acetyltransferase